MKQLGALPGHSETEMFRMESTCRKEGRDQEKEIKNGQMRGGYAERIEGKNGELGDQGFGRGRREHAPLKVKDLTKKMKKEVRPREEEDEITRRWWDTECKESKHRMEECVKSGDRWRQVEISGDKW